MRRALTLALAGLLLLPGCAAAIPAVAVAMIGRDRLGNDDEDAGAGAVPDLRPVMMQLRTATFARPPVAAESANAILPTAPAPAVGIAAPTPGPVIDAPPATSYLKLSEFLSTRLAAHRDARGASSVVLASDAKAGARFAGCGAKPLAVVVDIDEARTDGGRAWDIPLGARIVAVPGAREAIEAARAAGIAVVYTSDGDAESAVFAEVALDYAGLGPARIGETLWLRGVGRDAETGDGRRAAIARKYCVVALVGDRPADFSDGLALSTIAPDAVAALWGEGWFVLPNATAIVIEPQAATARKAGEAN